jgi:hypothetical protein
MKRVFAHSPTSPVSPAVFLICWGLVVVFAAMAALQLVTYEKFVPIIQNYQLFNSPAGGKVFAAIVVVAEVMALPFLLRMKLSRLFRMASAGFLVLASLSWVVLGLKSAFSDAPIIGTGIIGGFLASTNPTIVLPYAIILCVATMTALWGLRRDFQE